MNTGPPAFFLETNTKANDWLQAMGDALCSRPAWHREAACRESRANFYPERGQSAEPAKAVCAGCCVADECFAYIMGCRVDEPGVWAGTTNRERRKLHQQRRVAQKASA